MKSVFSSCNVAYLNTYEPELRLEFQTVDQYHPFLELIKLHIQIMAIYHKNKTKMFERKAK